MHHLERLGGARRRGARPSVIAQPPEQRRPPSVSSSRRYLWSRDCHHVTAMTPHRPRPRALARQRRRRRRRRPLSIEWLDGELRTIGLPPDVGEELRHDLRRTMISLARTDAEGHPRAGTPAIDLYATRIAGRFAPTKDSACSACRARSRRCCVSGRVRGATGTVGAALRARRRLGVMQDPAAAGRVDVVGAAAP